MLASDGWADSAAAQYIAGIIKSVRPPPFRTLLPLRYQAWSLAGLAVVASLMWGLYGGDVSAQVVLAISLLLFLIGLRDILQTRHAIRALNLGARQGGIAHDTGEGSISVHHGAHGEDLIWQVASGYFGCRQPDGSFDAERFAALDGMARPLIARRPCRATLPFL